MTSYHHILMVHHSYSSYLYYLMLQYLTFMLGVLLDPTTSLSDLFSSHNFILLFCYLPLQYHIFVIDLNMLLGFHPFVDSTCMSCAAVSTSCLIIFLFCPDQ
jgi:hypothetical protein